MRVDSKLYSTRPESGQTTHIEQKSYDLLEQAGVAYKRAEHDPANTIADCAEIEKVLGTKICKNLFLTNAPKSNYFLLLMPGEKRFVTKDVSHQAGSSRLSFASAEDMQTMLGIAPGSVSVLALMNDTEQNVQLLIDKDLLEEECFACHPCENTASLKMKTKDLLEKVLPATGHNPVFVQL